MAENESNHQNDQHSVPSLDKELFFKRLNKFYLSWKNNKDHEYWNDANTFCIISGKPDDASNYKISSIIHLYFLGNIEFPDTIMVFKQKKLCVLTQGLKYEMLEKILDGNTDSEIKLELLKRDKTDGNAKNFDTLLNHISNDNKNIGTLVKETPIGSFATSFKKYLSENSNKFNLVDVSKGIEEILAIKDEDEVENIRWASALSSKIYKIKFIEDMETIIDEEKKITHEKLTEDLETVFDDPSLIKINLDPDSVEACYAPIIQSGGKYDLKPSAMSNNDVMKYDVIMCSLGARYKGYCSNIARTYFIDPLKSMELNYEILREAHELCIKELRPGKYIYRIVEIVRSFIERKNPKLLDRLTRNLGFGIGLNFRESINVLSVKNKNTVIKEGMVFNVAFGFSNIEIPLLVLEKTKHKYPTTYSLFLADTVAVLKDETKVFTKVSKSWTKTHYAIDASEDKTTIDDNEIIYDDKKTDNSIVRNTRNQVLQSRLRDKQRQLEGKETDQERRDKHQALLMKQKREEAISRLKKKDDEKNNFGKKKDKKIQAYTNPSAYPTSLKDRQIYVDMIAECVLLPINGIPVPFHINTIKNVSKSEEEKATYLRINFYVPGVALGRDISPFMQNMIEKNSGDGNNNMFIKELGFRSINARNLNSQFRLIKELQKRVKQRQQQEQEESDLVEQESLVIIKDRRIPRLSDLNARPHITGRKTQGSLEAHSNGLRFTSNKNEKLDILYNNIKAAIFQPCDKELVVLIHFHLKHHIMIGKKKYRDIQFFTEVMEASQNLDNRRRSMYDPDELDEENRERALRSKLNTTFKEFCRKVEMVSDKSGKSISFDIPYRELGFQGTPFKEMVLLQPTVNCLVNLTESPFFIISLDEIEHVHFERVNFSSKNFDLVFIMKNFDILPLRISAIPTSELDSIKEWLDDIDLCFTTGTANLNWKSIMLTIKSDDRFYLDTDDDGIPKPAGWEFLKMEGSDDEDEDDEEAEDSTYEESSADSEEESEDSIGSEESDFLVDEDESSEAASEADDDEEEAMSWDEMEKKAAASDRMRALGKRGNDDDDDDDNFRPKKRKNTNNRR